ncbi:MAG: histidine phosphatase family protein [Bacteroidota bacterium]|nr:histidine phosphatase family protein [Ignavibacteria bacterium]MCU7498819.1 histidine phosphatase family protein [Ignavibacteria bacterium]MCU7512186.1 histidine phosphatase family protein [Ignavibacteria bacterium]MCU7520535.1 histidine phosphatase family protein [Ignavibacteria bacterium]MCU7524011.1 histidine phosphatase family protein [Ignavibacteria bacterium]
MTTFYLMRHGNTTAGDTIPGRLPGVHLSDNGRQQALRLADMLAGVPFDVIFSSPLERTRETAEPLCKHLKKDPVILDDIIEIDFGDWTGKSFSELEPDEKWKQFHTFRSGTRPPKGELMADVQKRMVDRLESLRHEYPQGTLALFSHGDPIKVAIAHYAGIPLDFILRIKINTGSFSVISIDDWGPKIHCLNQTGELPDGKPF